VRRDSEARRIRRFWRLSILERGSARTMRKYALVLVIAAVDRSALGVLCCGFRMERAQTWR